MKKSGFTLVEILIAMAIVIAIAVMMIGIFVITNPMAKGRDSQRKKDLNRIKQAFEEYFNDKGNYPNGDLLENLRDKSNCKSMSVFASYLSPWPCDPNGEPYKIIVDTDQFRIFTNLENREDKDIPSNWYTRTDILISGIGKTEINFGVSSPNVFWYGKYVNSNCDVNNCLSSKKGGCNSVDRSDPNCENGAACCGDNCYFYDKTDSGSCTSECKTSCCGQGCD